MDDYCEGDDSPDAQHCSDWWQGATCCYCGDQGPEGE